MRLTMIGGGYVGLTASACFAELGHSVTCVDLDKRKLETLRQGRLPIFEPGLHELISRNIELGQLDFSDSYDGIDRADAVFITVGTPSHSNGNINHGFVENAARQLARQLKPGAVVVIKSTVDIGTCRRVQKIIAKTRARLDFSVGSNPEFLREGTAVEDFFRPDRIIVGADDPRAAACLRNLYEPLTVRGVPLVETSTVNAELVKFASNAFLALKIGFINDVANLCEQLGAEVETVAHALGLDSRIGARFLAPGPGFGGSCFPKDTRAFAAIGRKNAAPQALVETLIQRNEHRKVMLAERVFSEIEHHGPGTCVAVLGLAFKANTDDVREAPALTIIPILQSAGIRIRAHDPKAIGSARSCLPGVRFFDTPYSAVHGADLALVLTEWEDYRGLDLKRVAQLMRGATLMDYRNLFSPPDVARAGLKYVCLGRAPIHGSVNGFRPKKSGAIPALDRLSPIGPADETVQPPTT
ncbi:UDP-glucose/GDP-mannose dehydrogenase family protein [Mesorhizobium sp. KR2-14]|uniref:UDP-glucose dehydrogenase family protein n=1 Tax=Mesorhizobium sp. KR2-14 TaxID=3156610 RepID=UPI0032B4772E